MRVQKILYQLCKSSELFLYLFEHDRVSVEEGMEFLSFEALEVLRDMELVDIDGEYLLLDGRIVAARYKDIDQKIVQYNRLDRKRADLQRALRQKELLSASYKERLNKHQNILKEIENSARQAINELESQEVKIQKEFLAELFAIQEEERQALKEIETKEQKEQEILREKIHEIELRMKELEFAIKQTPQFHYQKEAKLLKALQKKERLQQEQSLLQRDLKEVERAYEIEQSRFDEKKEALFDSFEKKKVKIEKELERIESFFEGENLVNLILRKSQEAQKYFFFLKDEVLAQRFDVEFQEGGDLLFELFFKDLHIEPNPLQKRKQALKEELRELKEEQRKDVEILQESFKKIEKKIERKKRGSNERLGVIYKELLQLQRLIQSLQEEKDLHIQKQQALFEAEVGKDEAQKLKIVEKEIKRLEQEIGKIESFYDEIVRYQKDKEEYFDKESENRRLLREKKRDLQELKESYQQERKRLERMFQTKERRLEELRKKWNRK